MSAPAQVIVHPDADVLAAAVAARLITALVDAQAARGSASVVLTGGGTGIGILAGVLASAACAAVDWSRVDVFWGDERFVPADDPERNELQARDALLDHVAVDPARVFAMAPSDGEYGDDVDRAAAAYAEILASRGSHFDVLLLGVGPEGHVASIFPDSPAVHETQASVVSVRDCPKPPPTRVSLTLPTIRAARQVWLCATGEGKADAVGRGASGVPETELPAAGALGLERTLWIVDPAAAATVPADLLPKTTD